MSSIHENINQALADVAKVIVQFVQKIFRVIKNKKF